jgi:hypothetical protein
MQGASLHEGLQAYNITCSQASSILTGLNKRLHELTKATNSIESRAAALIWAEANIVQTKTATDELLSYLDTSHKVLAC